VNAAQEDDQVAIVTYASDATVQQSLSIDVPRIAAAVREIQIDPAEEQGYTNTGAALRVAAEELSSFRKNPNARRVIVLLTDGLPTAPDRESADFRNEVVDVAADIQADAVAIYAIGLGSAVDAEFITQLSGRSDRSYVAPSASDLAAIYADITSSICEVAPPRVDVFPKTATFIETYE